MLKYLELIASYTQQHPELAAAHHFLFDLPQPLGAAPSFVVMGINPGESDRDWTLSPTPTEETSRYDFHKQAGPGREGIPWVRAAAFFLDAAPYVQTELFFWSSKDMHQFKARYGALSKSKHLGFCTSMNEILIDHYRPRAVVFPGLGQARICRDLFGLEPLSAVAGDRGRLVEIYSDGKRPWIFTKHWTGSFGFSNAERATVRDAIRRASARHP